MTRILSPRHGDTVNIASGITLEWAPTQSPGDTMFASYIIKNEDGGIKSGGGYIDTGHLDLPRSFIEDVKPGRITISVLRSSILGPNSSHQDIAILSGKIKRALTSLQPASTSR